MKNRISLSPKVHLCACGVLAFAGLAMTAAPAAGQAFSLRIETSSHAFSPLHSYVLGEVGQDSIFFCGISGMGLHGVAQNGTQIGFPTSVFSRNIHLADFSTGQFFTGSTDHLPDDVRLALTVTNATAVQFGHTLYIYGGYGPNLAGDDWHTRATVTTVDLEEVRSALRAGMPVPSSAFSTQYCAEGQVAGARIARMGDTFTIFGGANFTGDYGRAATAEFIEAYAIKAHLLDRTVSITDPEETFAQSNFVPPSGGNDRLRRRDLNVLPATLPTGPESVGPGFVVLGGVFRNNFFTWDTPMKYALGDADITHVTTFTQRMNQYETPASSFYSENLDQNRYLLFSGLSSHTWNGATFTPIVGGLFNVPWTAEITQITMDAGEFVSEQVISTMPLPMTNAELVPNPDLPKNENGQILLDDTPANEFLLGRIYGGLRAAAPAVSPATFASGGVYDVYLVWGVRGDINRDGVVNTADLAEILGSWGAGRSAADLNGDGVVNAADLSILLGLWGNNTPG